MKKFIHAWNKASLIKRIFDWYAYWRNPRADTS